MSLVDPCCAGLAKAFLMRTRRHPAGSKPSRDPMFRREGSSFDLRNIREYYPTDDPRRVDWRLEARTGRLFVKEYYEEERDGVVVLVDLSLSLEALADAASRGAGQDFAAKAAESTSASIAWTLGALGEPVFLLAFAARPLRALEKPRGGLGSRELDSFFQGIGPEERRGTAITQAARSARRRSRYGRAIIVSDFLDPNFDPDALPFRKLYFVRLHRDFRRLAGAATDIEVEDNESGRRLLLPWDGKERNNYEERLRELETSLAAGGRRRSFFASIGGQEDLPAALGALLEAFHA
ncbi:MAG TPA: DUF58 domain-containing protein [Rectinemataceae bacterium]|nr:DUF58 domain-containing protein [Rectinemataceae bacterium]